MKKAGLKPGKDIKVVSIDAIKAAFEAMIDGELNCSVECNPLYGPQLFDIIETVLAAKNLITQGAKQKLVKSGAPKPPGSGILSKKVAVKERVFDQSTAKKFVDSREY